MQEPETHIIKLIDSMHTHKIFAAFLIAAALSFSAFAVSSLILLKGIWTSNASQALYVYSGFAWATFTVLSLMADPS